MLLYQWPLPFAEEAVSVTFPLVFSKASPLTDEALPKMPRATCSVLGFIPAFLGHSDCLFLDILFYCFEHDASLDIESMRQKYALSRIRVASMRAHLIHVIGAPHRQSSDTVVAVIEAFLEGNDE
jgi:hypothetical protein